MPGQGGTFRVLQEFLDQEVLIKLKGGRMLAGTLEAYDGHLNILLKNAREVSSEPNKTRNLGTVLVRGDNVIVVSPIF
ncbi:MAG: RNA-binding protein [Desulfurococcales archaeon]|nr:RNA-binding protein [Desulfurococcales archaeon]MEB3765080.1 RNA-binding protein [Desulfurococcales archaeon]